MAAHGTLMDNEDGGYRYLLEEMLKFEGDDEPDKPIVNNECPDVENFITEFKIGKTDDIATVKCEDIHIKDEVDTEQSSSESTKFECRYCVFKGRIFQCKAHLNRHISAIHGKQYVYERSLSGQGKLPEEKICPYKCPGCRKEFTRKTALDLHLLKKHNLQHLVTSRIYGCNFCAYKSTILTNMKRHGTVKHGIKRENKFQCHKCSYFALEKQNLLKHLAFHSNLKQHQCPACQKGFFEKQDLDAHIVTKHKKNSVLLKNITRKIHDCTLCDYKSTKLYDFSRHMKRKHKQ